MGIQNIKFEEIEGLFDIDVKIVSFSQGSAGDRTEIKLEKCTK